LVADFTKGDLINYYIRVSPVLLPTCGIVRSIEAIPGWR
jgi:DNA primase